MHPALIAVPQRPEVMIIETCPRGAALEQR